MGELSRINGYVYKIEIGTLGYKKGKHIMPPMSYERRQADEPFLKPNLKYKGMLQIYKVTALKFGMQVNWFNDVQSKTVKKRRRNSVPSPTPI